MRPPGPASRMPHPPPPPQLVPEAASASRPLTHPRAIQECGEVLFLWEWAPRAAKAAGLAGFLPALLPYPALLVLAPHAVSSHTSSPHAWAEARGPRLYAHSSLHLGRISTP